MNFPVDKCPECGLDLKAAKPAGVWHVPKSTMTMADCPKCSRPFIMVEKVEAPALAPSKPK